MLRGTRLPPSDHAMYEEGAGSIGRPSRAVGGRWYSTGSGYSTKVAPETRRSASPQGRIWGGLRRVGNQCHALLGYRSQ
jgi:hypothetical protein